MTTSTAGHGSVAQFPQSKFDTVVRYLLSMRNHQPSYTDKDGQNGLMFPTSYGLRLQDEIFDDKKKMMRLIRVVKGETSIYADEQTRYKDTPIKEIPVERANFLKGELVIDERDAQTVQFLDLCNYNISNEKRRHQSPQIFLKLNVEKALGIAMKEEEQLMDAQTWCFKAPYTEVEDYARFMKLPTNRSESDTRFMMKEMAKKNPVKFMEGRNSPLLQMGVLVSKAIERGMIIVDPNTNSATWSSGFPICMAPVGSRVEDFIIEDAVRLGTAEKLCVMLREALHVIDHPVNKGVEMPKGMTEESMKNLTLEDIIPESKKVNASVSRENPLQMSREEFMKACKERDLIVMPSAGWFQLHNFANAEDKSMRYKGHEALNQFFKSEGGREWVAFANKEISKPLFNPNDIGEKEQGATGGGEGGGDEFPE